MTCKIESKNALQIAEADLQVERLGTIVLLTPLSSPAYSWLKKNIQLEEWQWLYGSIPCEPRYIPAIIEGAQASGLTVQE